MGASGCTFDSVQAQTDSADREFPRRGVDLVANAVVQSELPGDPPLVLGVAAHIEAPEATMKVTAGLKEHDRRPDQKVRKRIVCGKRRKYKKLRLLQCPGSY